MESEKVLDLQLKLHELNTLSFQDIQSFQETESVCNLIILY